MRPQLLSTLLALVPVALAFVSLLAGRYPGEALLASARHEAPRRRAPSSVGSARRPASRLGLRAVVLPSCGLTGRAPPAPALR